VPGKGLDAERPCTAKSFESARTEQAVLGAAPVIEGREVVDSVHGFDAQYLNVTQ